MIRTDRAKNFNTCMPKIYIEKLIQGGQGLGRLGDKVIFVWGALPGEEVEYRILKDKPRYSEAVATKIITPSPWRVTEHEDHYLACSPWQTLAIAEEERWKKMIAIETYQKIGKFSPESLEIVPSPQEYGYRTKIEFGFTTDEKGSLTLAVRERDSAQLIPVTACVLAHPTLNKAAQYILIWLKENYSTANQLDSLVLRCTEEGQVIARLVVNTPEFLFGTFILEAGLIGFEIRVKKIGSTDKPLFQVGATELRVILGATSFVSGLDSFFQINLPMFQSALSDIKSQVVPRTHVLDYYGGVGAIGLSVARMAEQVTVVEENPAAVGFAGRNINDNNLPNAEAVCTTAAKARNLISRDKTVIVDPPRTGLEKEVVATLLSELPERIMYLSCDIATQARDLGALLSAYKPIFSRLYNFFPHTPHIEALLVLERR